METKDLAQVSMDRRFCWVGVLDSIRGWVRCRLVAEIGCWSKGRQHVRSRGWVRRGLVGLLALFLGLSAPGVSLAQSCLSYGAPVQTGTFANKKVSQRPPPEAVACENKPS